MCGIAGIVDLKGRPVPGPALESMADAMHHRGPDARGVHAEQNVGLAHTRLSILDLRPESNQPFESSDGRYLVVYNGEIFNYVELRKELGKGGISFRTTSDTEVLVEAYAAWGPACLSHFNGMWAFAVYDRLAATLFCARDRFGIKPFHYGVSDGRFWFASEARALLSAERSFACPDYDALSLALREGRTGAPERSCFLGIRRLAPGHSLTVKTEPVLSRYWSYPSQGRDTVSMDDAAAELRELLSDSVRIRLRSDVPVGITLSSGVDSNAIASLVREHTDAPITAFTADYGSGDESEAPIARLRATELGLTFRPIRTDPGDFLDLLRRVILHVETPHASPAMIPYWRIVEGARREVTVLLEGQGADELLAGYRVNFFPHAFYDLVRSGHPVEAMREFAVAYRTLGSYRHVGRARFGGWVLRAAMPGLHGPYRRLRGDESVYRGPLRHRTIQKRLKVGTNATGSLNRALAVEHQTLLRDLLQYGDAISMAHSLESRLPFMDHRLVEFGFRLPGRLKYQNGYGKEVLRRALADIVPTDILRARDKLGFVTPVATWFRDHPEETLYPVLLSPACRRRGLFDPDRLEAMMRQHVEGRRNLAPLLFRWLTTELWFQIFIDDAHSSTVTD